MAFAVGVAKYVPPPTIREEIVSAFAHCPDPRCKGTAQEPVQAVMETTEWTFASRGGGDDPGGMGNLFLNMVENSQTRLRFADLEADLPCPHCGKARELSGETRPVYPIQVGGANALLRLQEMGIRFDPDRQEEIQKGAQETPLELLQRRYINDEVTDEEFAAKQRVLAGGSPAAVAEVTAEVTAAQDERMQEMQDQIDALLRALGESTPPPKRGPGRPRKEPEA
jgi:hypothetical protein